MQLILGDCLEHLKTLGDNLVDAVVTDAPYGLAFMGKTWDYKIPSVAIWREVCRVLKPGGHLLSFGGTRTYHRMVVNIEDAGFEIRDQLQWIYGSGFPKSLDISKAIDKAAGAEREVVGFNPNHRGESQMRNPFTKSLGQNGSITAPATDEAKQWSGWGTALKPANEPIVLARKPLIGTVAENVLKWGTGALNIDASRIAVDDDDPNHRKPSVPFTGRYFDVADGKSSGRPTENLSLKGRWPANVLFDEDAAAGLGEPSRFFYVAKASKRERNAGLEGMPKKDPPGSKRSQPAPGRESALGQPRENHHPTVKPIGLMEYLVRLVTPPGGVILDPFMGSGTTGIAAKNLGYKFIGIEREVEYLEIAKRRLAGA